MCVCVCLCVCDCVCVREKKRMCVLVCMCVCGWKFSVGALAGKLVTGRIETRMLGIMITLPSVRWKSSYGEMEVLKVDDDNFTLNTLEK